MTFTIQNMEFYLMVLVRVSGFVFVAPFFSHQSVPAQMKAAISILLSILVIQTIPVVTVTYSGVFGFSVLVYQCRYRVRRGIFHYRSHRFRSADNRDSAG